MLFRSYLFHIYIKKQEDSRLCTCRTDLTFDFVVVEPKLWYGDRTRLTPKQKEAALGLSSTCGSGIPAYICTMKKSNVVKRHGTLCHCVRHLSMPKHDLVLIVYASSGIVL